MTNGTKNLLDSAHFYFDELGYRPATINFNSKELEEAFERTLNLCETINDVSDALLMYLYLKNHFEKICSKAQKYESYWRSMPFIGTEKLSLVNYEDNIGAIYFHNALFSSHKTICMNSPNFDTDEIQAIDFDGGYLQLFSDSNYKLRYSRIASDEMVIVNRNDAKVCVLKLDYDNNIVLKNNETDYVLIYDENLPTFYKKDNLPTYENEESDFEKAVAYFTWDIVHEESDRGVARLTLLQDGDLDLMSLIVVSSFLMFKAKMEGISHATALSTLVTINAMNIVRRH